MMPLTATTELEKLSDSANTKLFSCKTVFPFTLFPDEIYVDKTKVTIAKKVFFLSKNVKTILIKDIRFIDVGTSPFFATLSIEIINYEQNPAPIRFLKRNDAIKMHDIISGMIAVKAEHIDLEDISRKKIVEEATTIGSSPEE